MFLRMVARPLMAKVKETTGIVGLEVVPNAREVLIKLYAKTLKEIEAVPEDEGYRKAVESSPATASRSARRKRTGNDREAPRLWPGRRAHRRGPGRTQTHRQDDRVALSPRNFSYWIAEWDPWGVPDDYECEVIEDDAPVPKHVPLHRPGPLPEEFYKTLDAVNSGTLQDAISSSKKDEPAITSGDAQPKE
ncbi:hypothetical protein C3L33_03274, partial [Rhododendron williamsianum]